jgi:predicted RecB family nuclease
VVRDSVIFPADGRGLKSLARWIGFEWREEDPGGAQSMAWWAEYLDDPSKNGYLRDRLLAYNEDDVRATFVLRDWLEAATQNF